MKASGIGLLAALLAAAGATAEERPYEGPDMGVIQGPAAISFCATEEAAIEVLKRASERLEAALATGKPFDIEAFVGLAMPLAEVERCYTVLDALHLPTAVITRDGEDIEGRWWRFVDQFGDAIANRPENHDRIRDQAVSIELVSLTIIKSLYRRQEGYFNIYVIGTKRRPQAAIALPPRT